ncbi:MAG: Na+/H+ antiporter subunit E [Candidatus Hadarchaeia archaeon]
MKYKKSLVIFICLIVAWIILTHSLSTQELLIGLASAGFVSAISYNLFSKKPLEMLNPKRISRVFAYIPTYIYAEIKSHLDVAYRIIHPDLPIEPSIVKIPTELKSEIGITSLANSITMTPGTLTVDLDEDSSNLYVHWINTQYEKKEDIKKRIISPYGEHLEEGFK